MLERIKQWLRRAQKPSCDHKWGILIEKYPSFTKDYWQCSLCGTAEVFQNDAPPVKVRTRMCNLGHTHIVNR